MVLIAFCKMFSVIVGEGKGREGDGERGGKDMGKGVKEMGKGVKEMEKEEGMNWGKVTE